MTITDARYATESTDVRETNVSTDTIDIKIGEVQATPTQYTVLDRLKTIGTNTATFTSTNSSNIDNIATNTAKPTLLTQEYVRPTEFEISVEITRATNATPYAANEIVNGDSASTLPTLDFTTLGSVANRIIQITEVTLLSSYGASTGKIIPIIHLYNANAISGQTLTDQTAFNPSYSETKAKRVTTFESVLTPINHGTGFYLLMQTEITRNCTLDASGYLYPAIITTGAYTPASGETITITVKGYLL